MQSSDTELNILEQVRDASGEEGRLTQRELASAVGLSLGMTNALLRRMAEKGWLVLNRSSTRSIRYLLTPAGSAELARRTLGYFRRASENVSRYRERIEAFVIHAKAEGVRTIVLVGTSEADFVLEAVCSRHGVSFLKSADPERARGLAERPGMAMVWGEGIGAYEAGACEGLNLAAMANTVPSGDSA